MPLHKIAVLGLGKVGTLAAKLLHESGFDVTGFDSRAPQEMLPFAVRTVDLGADAVSVRPPPVSTPYCRACPIA
jgi:saccharopine dehydrogenase (NAD+, L-lysine-forming)